MIVPVQQDEDFLADFEEADGVTGAIHIWWLGQSGFLLKWDKFGLLIDPYLSDSITRDHSGTNEPLNRVSERVIDPLLLKGVDLVVATNNNPDRLDPETILPLRAANPNLKMILPAGNVAEADEMLGKDAPPLLGVNAGTYIRSGQFDFHGINSANPKIRRDPEGNSKDLGFVIVFGPFAIYHSGETVWHTNLVKEVRRWSVNVAFLPINGDAGNIGEGTNMNGFEAAALAKAVSASLVIPSHFDLFDQGNPSTEEFTTCCDRLGQRHRQLKIGQRMTMGPITAPSGGKALPSEPYSGDWGLGY